MPDLSALRDALVADEEFAPSPASVAAAVTYRLDRQHRRRRRGSLVGIAAAVALVASVATFVHRDGGSPATPALTTAVPTTAVPTTGRPTTSSISTPVQRSSGPATARTLSVSAPVFGRAGLSPIDPVVVSVANGRIVSLALTAAGGKPLTGRLSTDRSVWTLVGAMTYGTRYSVTGTAEGLDGRRSPIGGSFSTLTPASQADVVLSPQTGTTRGVGVTISVSFPAGLTPTDRAAVQQRLSVKTSVPVEGSWAWLQRDGGWQADWRPEEFWPPNTSVEVAANLFGVRLAAGVYGSKDLRSTFRVGRDQVVRVDGGTHRFVVTRNGSTVSSYPAALQVAAPTDGLGSGTYVVQEMVERRLQSTPNGQSETKWVLRLTSGGALIGAPTAADPGDAVAVDLSEADAQAYYRTALVGDPVLVVNGNSTATADQTEADWSIPWADWQKLSG